MYNTCAIQYRNQQLHICLACYRSWMNVKSFHQILSRLWNQYQQKFLHDGWWLVFRKSKDLYLIITQKLIILKSVKSGGFHHWNLADFTIEITTCGNVFNITCGNVFNITSDNDFNINAFNITCGNVFNITCGNALYFISGSWIIPWPIFWWWKRQRYYIRFVCVNVKKVQ